MSSDSSCDLVLASASPRRKQLLESLGFSIHVQPADIDETLRIDEAADVYVKRLALEKAQAVVPKVASLMAGSGLAILAADTIVVADGEVFGKPVDEADAMRMWQVMSGQTHQVLTAIALVTPAQQYQALSVSHVKLATVTEAKMQRYWASDEPQDKAGAYAIQGLAAAWVESISGSHSGIVGLPLYELNELLKNIKLDWL